MGDENIVSLLTASVLLSTVMRWIILTVLNHATQASINKPLGICRDLGDNSPAQDILWSTIVSACVWNDTWCCALVTAIFFLRLCLFPVCYLTTDQRLPHSHTAHSHTHNRVMQRGFSTFKCLSEQFGPNIRQKNGLSSQIRCYVLPISPINYYALVCNENERS